MPETFDIYLASVKWASKDNIESITLAKCPLESTQLLDGIYIYDSVIYQKKGENYLQVVVESKSPVFLNENELLYNVKDSNIWIIKGEWRESERGMKYHYCPSINTPGDLFLKNASKDIHIRIAPNFSDFDFEALKQDFNGELWDIITSNNSKTKTSTNAITYGVKTFRFAETQSIIEFISTFDSIAKNPKKELTAAITFNSVKKVKPVPQTYKELAIHMDAHTLPSKYSRPDIDVYENRYLNLMLYKVSQIINYNIKYTSLQINRLITEIKNIKEQIKNLSIEPIVNGVDILNEIHNQKNYYERWLNKWRMNKNRILSECNNSNCLSNFNFEIIYDSDWNNGYDFWGKKDGIYSLVCFPVDMSEIFEGQKNQIVKLKANCNENGTVGNTHYPKYVIEAIELIDLIQINYTSIITKQEANYEKLKNNDWKLFSILNTNEKTKITKERNNQIITLEKSINKIEAQISNLAEFSKEITLIAPKLLNLLNGKFAKSINFKRLVRFQPSMTFIQNPKYRNALKLYNEILNAEGIDIAVFGYYEEILQYSIREMPQVYELWCLVSVIKILEETFSLKANPSDLKQLISSIQPNVKKLEKHIKLEFIGNLNNRNIVLHYQKRINDKRPDFILQISSGARTINLVLDAKFKNYNYKLSATEEIRLLNDKYKKDSNHFVFSLHPNNDLNITERSIKLTNLGGEHVFTKDGNIELPFHQFGYIMVKPLQKDNLKKLIGMAFEYLLETNPNASQPDRSLNPKPENELICLACGGSDFEIKTNKLISFGDKARFNYVYQCKNNYCNHTVYVNYCWNCKTKLFKHGSHWDYHKTSVWSIFDIHCPCCGMTVADFSL